GAYSAPEINTVVGWASLEGSSSHHQPILNERRDVALIVTGECFADPDVQSDLRQRGHDFENRGAAWLVHLYEERGERFFELLNGTFSGLLIDHRLGKAFLFNDRYGMERIYYHAGPDRLAFASEAKALLQILPELRAFDHDGVTQLL